MSNIEQLCLEEALEDSPQMRNFVKLFQDDADILKEFTKEFQSSCEKFYNAQLEVCQATQSLSSVVKKMESLNLPLDVTDCTMKATINQFGVYLDEMSSLQHILTTHLNENMMFPINRFLSGYFEGLQGMTNMYNLVSDEADQSLMRYMKLPKKCTERSRVEAVDDVFQMRRKFHISALHYYSELNALQHHRQFVFLDTLTGAMHANRAYSQLAHEALGKTEVEDFLKTVTERIDKRKQNLLENRQNTEELALSMDEQCFSMYYPEQITQSENAAIPPAPNPRLVQKTGYLMLRAKSGILQPTRWARAYFCTQGGNLMTQSRHQLAGCLIMDLNDASVYAEATDCEDRRNVFQIVSPNKKKNLVLQSENEKERDEWIATVTNIAMDSSSQQPDQSPSGHTVLKERSTSSFFSSLLSNTNSPVKQTSITSSSDSTPPTPQAQGMGGNNYQQQQYSFQMGHFLAAQPIQFDLSGSVGETVDATRRMAAGSEEATSDSEAQRANPFNADGGDGDDESSPEWARDLEPALLPCCRHAAVIQTFPVRFLGSVEVPADRGEGLITEVIRHIMGARAVHNMFRMADMVLVVSNEGLWLVEPANRCVRQYFKLEDVAFWCSHKENNRLFGFITRSADQLDPATDSSFMCHALECSSGDKISSAIRAATKVAFQLLLDNKALADGKRSQNNDSTSDAISPPTTENTCSAKDDVEATQNSENSHPACSTEDDGQNQRPSEGDGDERKVEGAECEGDT